MNRGLLEKSVREILPTTLGFTLMVFVTETVVSFVLTQMHGTMLPVMLKMPFARPMFSALLGTPVTGDMAAQLIQAIPWVHPMVLLVIFAHETTICTRMPAAEIDRGTIDVLLGLPVSRWQVYSSHSLVWALSGLGMMIVGLCGNWLGFTLAGFAMVSPERMAISLINGYALYLAIGGLACLIATLSDRRGRAVGVVIPVIVASFLINFLAEFWKPAKNLNFLSVMNYYRPILILQSGAWPKFNLTVLFSAALVFWSAGAVVFHRRDIRTL